MTGGKGDVMWMIVHTVACLAADEVPGFRKQPYCWVFPATRSELLAGNYSRKLPWISCGMKLGHVTTTSSYLLAIGTIGSAHHVQYWLWHLSPGDWCPLICFLCSHGFTVACLKSQPVKAGLPCVWRVFDLASLPA